MGQGARWVSTVFNRTIEVLNLSIIFPDERRGYTKKWYIVLKILYVPRTEKK